ncbi:MAG TPA: translocation/assembly module TamB domain-containing protein, partial [Terriglobales bacterium]|nr:translocation/assembly module TamB domain-containing protein [Terriglobales bacterium]
MSIATHPHGAHRHHHRLRIWLAVGTLVLMAGAVMYLTSARFQARVRRMVVARLQESIGGRVEIGALRWSLPRLQVDIDDLAIYGREAPGEAPFINVGHVQARLKILSLFRQEIGLRYLLLERPVVHFIVYPDGSTNQPVPGAVQRDTGSPVARLFDLAVSRVEVRQGGLLWNNARSPLEFNADELAAHLSYSRWRRRYDGDLSVGQLQISGRDFRLPPGALATEFSLHPAAVEVKAFRWSAGRSHLTAHGQVQGFRDPQVDLTYDAAADLAQVSAVLHTASLRGGLLEFGGQAVTKAGELTLSGHAAVRELEWQDASLHLAALGGGAEYSATRRRLVLSHLFLSTLGGVVTGDAEIQEWLPGLAAAPAKANAPTRGLLRLRLEKLRLAAVADAFSTPALPLSRIGLTGEMSGTANATCRGWLQDLDADLALEVRPPGHVGARELPVTATLRGLYHAAAQTLELSRLDLSTPATHVEASGILGSTGGRLELSAATADLGELRPLLAAFRAPARVPVSLHGHATFRGSLSGKLGTPAAAGHLETGAVDSVVPWAALWSGPAPGASPTVHLQWDSLSAEVQISPSQAAAHQGVVRRGPAEVSFDASAALRNYSFNNDNLFHARLSLRGSDVTSLQALLGYSYPVSGKLNLDLDVTGTPQNLDGSGRLQIASARIYGEPFQSLRSDLRLAGHTVQFNDLLVAHNGAQGQGSAAYDFSNRGMRFDLAGSGFDLARFDRLQGPHLTVTGSAGFTAQGSGTLDVPVVNASVRVGSLTINGEVVGGLEIDAVSHGPDLHLSSRSQLVRGSLSVAGDIQMREQWPARLTLEFSQLDFDPLLRTYVPGEVTNHSSLGGRVALEGPLRQPRRLNVSGEFTQLALDVEHVALTNGGPIRFSLANEVFRLDSMRIVGEGTDLSARGTAQLSGDRTLDLRAEGVASLKVIQTINPGLSSGGTLTVRVAVQGTAAQPELRGELEIQKGELSFADLPNGLSDVNGVLVFNQNRLQVRALTARSGGGTLDLSGTISYVRGLYFNLSATSKDTRLRYPPGVSSTASANLHFEGTTAGSLLSGEVLVTRFSVDPRFDFAAYLARAKQIPVGSPATSPLNNLRLDIHVVSIPGLEMQTSQGQISGEADLHLRGTVTHPVLLGRVTLAEGDLSFGGAKYHLDRGDLTFTNPVRIEPVFNLEATTRVRDYDVTLGL